MILLKGYLLHIYLGLEVILASGFAKYGGLSQVGVLFYCDWLVLISPKLDV